jgi:hypothetical protein
MSDTLFRRCAGCTAIISQGRSDRLYCTPACKQRAHRASRNEKGAKTVTAKGPVPSVIRGTNGVLIAQAARLGYLGGPNDTVLDVTYGRGKWWTRYRPTNLLFHDLAVDGVDFRQLPEPDNSVQVVCFDPPYITTGNRATSTRDDLYARYGLGDMKGWQTCRDLIAQGIKECARVVAPNGFLLVKCMDYVESAGKTWNFVFVVQTGEQAGLKFHDRFIHHSGPGPQPTTNRDGSPRRQVHAREVGSFLCVFRKPREQSENLVVDGRTQKS